MPPLSNSSVCVPLSAIRPSSNTSTRSDRSAVESRWATLTVVRPTARRSSARSRVVSVSGSTADVASSRIRRPGSPSCALARATNWRSPTDSPSPRSPAIVSRPSGRRSTHSRSPSMSMAASTSSSPDPARPNPMFALIVVSNRKPSWGTIRTARRRSSGDASRRSTPPTRTRPAVGSASRASSFTKVVFPEPVSPTTATEAPAGSTTSIPRSTWPPVRYENSTASARTSSAPSGTGRGSTGSTTSTGVSSTFRIFHHPARAVWVWSSTSPSSVIGVTRRFERNTNATSSPELTPQAPPHQTPAPMTEAMAATPRTSEIGSTSEKYLAATNCCRYWASTADRTRCRVGSRYP